MARSWYTPGGSGARAGPPAPWCHAWGSPPQQLEHNRHSVKSCWIWIIPKSVSVLWGCHWEDITWKRERLCCRLHQHHHPRDTAATGTVLRRSSENNVPDERKLGGQLIQPPLLPKAEGHKSLENCPSPQISGHGTGGSLAQSPLDPGLWVQSHPEEGGLGIHTRDGVGVKSS